MRRTQEGHDDDHDIEREARPSAHEEGRDRFDRDDHGADSDGGEQLDGEDRINFANECPPELRALQHHWVQRPRSGLHVILPERLGPHLLCSAVLTPNSQDKT